ncbi:MAG: pyridoxal-phosphate dependent enzyme [Betaproteobacteria bacterium]|nr:pyridoxal-phosphate dependent enzyme [Betaproteobacteria bacterium]
MRSPPDTAAANTGGRVFRHLPESATAAKLAAIRLLGAEIIIHGAAWDGANALAMHVARESGRAYIHPFDNRAVMAGQGTIVPELLQRARARPHRGLDRRRHVDLGNYFRDTKHFSPATRVIGVETEGAESMFQSRTEKLLTEPATSCSVAALIEGRITVGRKTMSSSYYAEQTLLSRKSMHGLPSLPKTATGCNSSFVVTDAFCLGNDIGACYLR